MRSSAWMLDFSSTHSTTAASGGLRYSPTMSRTLSMNWGSVDSFQAASRCGLSPKARQIPTMAVWLIPLAWAMERVDQWVASVGVSSSVLVITASTWASVIVRGTPGRGSSTSPSNRRVRNRARHLPTVFSCTPSRLPASTFDSPSAQASTIRQRNPRAWLLVGRLAHRWRA